MDKKLVKGILLENTVSFLRERKGEPAVKELEKGKGNMIFNQHQMYPLEDLIDLQELVIAAVYGEKSEMGFKELGNYEFEAFASSVVGATLTNVATSPKELLSKIQEIWNTVTNFGTRKLTKINENDNFAILEIIDDPRSPSYLSGVIEAGLKSIKVEATIKIITEKDNLYRMEIRW